MYWLWSENNIPWKNSSYLIFTLLLDVEFVSLSKSKIKDIAMAKNKEQSEEQPEVTEKTKRAKIKSYEKLIDRLKEERTELQEEFNRDYREARRYVRSHPEEGVLFAFVGGIALGYVLGKLGRK